MLSIELSATALDVSGTCSSARSDPLNYNFSPGWILMNSTPIPKFGSELRTTHSILLRGRAAQPVPELPENSISS
jgi:hypothetical protein